MPIREWLAHTQVVEIMVNRPGELWVEILGRELEHHDAPDLTADAIRRMCEQVASYSNQSVNEETPLLSAAMPNGERFQGVLPPAAPNGGSFSIRKQVIRDLSLDDYVAMGALENVRMIGPFRAEKAALSELDKELLELLRQGTVDAHTRFLRKAVQGRVTMIVSGGTSSGKTTFLNALLKEIALSERVISIEDTRELRPPQPNYTAFVASKGNQGLSKATIQSLLEAALRMRPDRLFLGEIRGSEAYSFLQAVNTGHPGSLTTLHADSPLGAFERLGLMTLEAGLGLSKAEVIDYVRFVVPVVVQLTRHPKRGVSEIYFRHWRAG
ncbi:type IV secretion system protein VirB11 [Rhizobiales bacterium GAS113]|nr:type IV secretion system protein VirB11 [Rhizobiales bacterium GAS113]